MSTSFFEMPIYAYVLWGLLIFFYLVYFILYTYSAFYFFRKIVKTYKKMEEKDR